MQADFGATHMSSFFYSKWMLYILALLLVIVFFLPDLIGTLPALLIGGIIIGFALFVYNKWCQTDDDTNIESKTHSDKR